MNDPATAANAIRKRQEAGAPPEAAANYRRAVEAYNEHYMQVNDLHWVVSAHLGTEAVGAPLSRTGAIASIVDMGTLPGRTSRC